MTEDVAPLHPRFTVGTHRLVSPEQTLARLAPLLDRLGITRVAEITGLDRDMGVPTYTAIRAGGLVLQTGNGKGLTAAAAKVSAIMEATELFHAENPDTGRFIRASTHQMQQRGLDTLTPRRTPADGFFHAPDHVIDWVQGQDLISDRTPWLPASAAFYIEPTIYRTHTNGLASGNHVVEATLHGLYEVLERDAVSRLVEGERLRVRQICRVVAPQSVPGQAFAHIVQRIRAAHSQLVLMSVPSWAPVHVFWAVLLNHRPHRASTMLNTGAGAHIDARIAATRAVTEAIQSRLTLVHSARDDIVRIPSFAREQTRQGAAFRYFAGLEPDTAWRDLAGVTEREMADDGEMRTTLARLLRAFERNDHANVLRIDMRKPDLDLPVVKVIVPSLAFRRELF